VSRKVVDSALLARLAHLSVRAGQVVEGTLTGQHRSPHQGASVEFAQHREYAPGDEIKHIDWNAYARSDRYQVKQFEDETNLRAFLLLDTSGSMDYARKGLPTKLEYAARLTAALAWVLLRQGDAVGLLTFGETLGTYVPPRSRPDHFWNLVRVLEEEPVGGPTDVVRAMEHIAEVSGRRAVVFLVSDCFDFSGRVAAIARQLRRRRHRVVVFQVLDPDETDFPFNEVTLFEELESDQRELADPRGMRDAYLEEMRAFCEGLRRELLEGGVAYYKVDTREPLDRTVFEFFQSGGR
jgi:uncharacterized protein (DUF58 family)